MRPFKAKSAFAALVGLVALIVAACGSSSNAGPTTSTNSYDYNYTYTTPTHQGGTIVFGDWQVPDSANQISSLLDPTVVNQDVFNFMWDSCIVQLPNVKLGVSGWKPSLCSEVPSKANGDESADGTTTKIKIDPNAKWSDGQPIVADDLLMYYNMFVDPAIAGQGGTPPWDKAKVSKIDNTTVQFNWGQPYAPFLYNLLSFFPSHLYPKVFSNGTYNTKEAQKLINDPTFLNKPVVDGPYMPQSFGAGGTTVVMVPNPQYHSNFFHKPVADKIIFQGAGSKDALIQAFKAGGTYNQVEDFTFADLPKFGGIPQNEVVESAAYEFEHLELNERPQAPNAKLNGGTSIFADVAVRKAFAEGFNKCRILTGILGVSCTDPLFATNEVTAPVDPAFDPNAKLPAYNSAQAGADLTAAGYPIDKATGGRTFKDGKTPMALTVVTTKGNLVRNSTLALLQQDWQTNLGIQLTLVEDSKIFAPFTGGGFLATGNYDVALFAFSSAALGDSLTAIITTPAIPSVTNQGGQNYSGIKDATIDQQLTAARQELDPTKANADYTAIYDSIAENVYYIPLYARPNISLVTPNLGNYKQNPTNIGNTWNGGEWFLAQ